MQAMQPGMESSSPWRLGRRQAAKKSTSWAVHCHVLSIWQGSQVQQWKTFRGTEIPVKEEEITPPSKIRKRSSQRMERQLRLLEGDGS